MFYRLFNVGNRVQHKAVARFQSDRDGGKKVHEALKDAAHVRQRAFCLDQRHILRRYASLEEAAADFIPARHIRKADGEIPFATHTVIQSAAIA